MAAFESTPVRDRLAPLLSVDELERFKNLLLFAQATVDGFFAGKHRSSHPGASAEFRDYKSYVQGDPVDRIDWRAYGRSRRLFIRRYEDETDMVGCLLVDASASMRYAGARRLSKCQHAARVAAALAYLMLRQGDKAALPIFDQRIKTYIPPDRHREYPVETARRFRRIRPVGNRRRTPRRHRPAAQTNWGRHPISKSVNPFRIGRVTSEPLRFHSMPSSRSNRPH